MTNQEKIDYLNNALTKSDNALRASIILYNSKLYEDSVSRAYYAIFNSARCFGILDDFDTSKHSGIKSHFDLNYIKTGVFDKSFSKILHTAFSARQVSDYDLKGNFSTKEDAEKAIKAAKTFIPEVQRVIRDRITQLQIEVPDGNDSQKFKR